MPGPLNQYIFLEVPKPIRIQLAIQGGGAKLTAILAVLQAVAELQDAKQILVTRIAATSAGSIAGCLFAAPVGMAVVRTHLKAKADAFAREYRMPGKLRVVQQLLAGSPFWDVSLLKKSLIELFGKRTTLAELAKPVALIATDLKNRKKVVRTGNDPLIDSMLDSCAIPLFFRTFADQADGAASIVDGGICANLPSEELTAGADGDVLGISFTTTIVPANPTGIVGFSKALLNTAMDHAVLKARTQLGDRLLSIETAIDTFDFARAMTEGLEVGWDNCYRQGKEFFERYVETALEEERRQKEDADAEAKRVAEEAEHAQRQAQRIQDLVRSLNDVRSKVEHVYRQQEHPKPFAYEQVSMHAVAHSLASDIQTDVLIRKIRFHAAKDPIYAYKSTSLTAATEQPLGDDFRIYDKDGNELEFEKIELEPVQKVINGSQAIFYPKIMYFEAPLLPGDSRAPFELVTFERYTSVLAKLRSGSDWLSVVVSRASTPVPVVDIVVHLPKTYAGTILSGGGIRDEAGNWIAFHPGQVISTPILNKEYEPPDGFFALGWRGLNVPPGTRFGCNINR